MNFTSVYQRGIAGQIQTITVMAYIGAEQGDSDEIRVIRTIDDRTTEDRIAYHGKGGSDWLQTQQADWTADGYDLVSTRPGTGS